MNLKKSFVGQKMVNKNHKQNYIYSKMTQNLRKYKIQMEAEFIIYIFLVLMINTFFGFKIQIIQKINKLQKIYKK